MKFRYFHADETAVQKESDHPKICIFACRGGPPIFYSYIAVSGLSLQDQQFEAASAASDAVKAYVADMLPTVGAVIGEELAESEKRTEELINANNKTPLDLTKSARDQPAALSAARSEFC